MSGETEILLGNGWHTNYSDELWYLVIPETADEIRLEARFQSDAVDRTGYPRWATTEFCVSKDDAEATCHVPYSDAGHLLSARRMSFVPEEIWSKAMEECQKLKRGSTGG